MKKLILILFLLPLFAKAQKIELPLKDSTIMYEEIISVKDSGATADKMFTLAQSWFANTFNNSKSVLRVNDRVSHQLIGKGSELFENGIGYNPSVYLNYTIAVDIKDGKYRYRVYDLSYESGSGYFYQLSQGYSHYLHDEIKQMVFESKKKAIKRYEKEFIFADTKARALIQSLKSNMSNLNADAF
jgi:hypothetical protein